MGPSPFVSNIFSILVIILALTSFYLMARKNGRYVDIIFAIILGIVVLLKIIY